jgi:hypothetical protein
MWNLVGAERTRTTPNRIVIQVHPKLHVICIKVVVNFESHMHAPKLTHPETHFGAHMR